MPIGIDPETVKDLHHVLFVAPDRRNSSAVFVRSIPREGEILWVNLKCYEVDKVARYFVASDRGAYERSIVVFLKETGFDKAIYQEPDPYQTNREDSMNTMA